jgi:hypothetical protein
MNEPIDEGKLRFQFGNGWTAVKLDVTDWHRRQMKSQLKAMDILAHHNGQHWWIEIKNFEGDEESNSPRMTPTELAEVKETREWVDAKGWKPIVTVAYRKEYIIDEVLAKVQQTIISLAVAARANHSDLISFAGFSHPPVKINIVLLIFWAITDFKRFARLLQQKLDTALQPYGMQGIVMTNEIAMPGLDCTISRIA